MSKTNLIVFAGAMAAIAAISALAVQAATASLTASCGSSISGNIVTWTATATGGNTSTPYSFLWSGDSSVAGSTSTSMNVTYGTNGTYMAIIRAMDASSTVATSTCSATVTANVSAATTSTLNVVVSVNNTQGGTAVPANFTIMVGGASANPSSFTGSSTGTAVVVTGGTGYSVSASSIANYSASMSGNCSGPITAGGADACTVTEAYVSPTTTPPLPRVNQPSLSIGPNGMFLAHGMTVTSVASGSFQAQVWGITYTVNWSGNLFPEFYFRDGHGGNATTSPAMQIAVGDEVGVSGKVTSANPLVVNANAVRDYSITMPRPGLRKGQPSSPFYNGQGNGGGNGNGGEGENDGNGGNASASADFTGRLNDLLNQLHGLQNLFKQQNGNGH
jgi:hypothetical protein